LHARSHVTTRVVKGSGFFFGAGAGVFFRGTRIGGPSCCAQAAPAPATRTQARASAPCTHHRPLIVPIPSAHEPDSILPDFSRALSANHRLAYITVPERKALAHWRPNQSCPIAGSRFRGSGQRSPVAYGLAPRNAFRSMGIDGSKDTTPALLAACSAIEPRPLMNEP